MTVILRIARKATSIGVFLCFGAGTTGTWAATRLASLQILLTKEIERRRVSA
jgi:hypothetical protein